MKVLKFSLPECKPCIKFSEQMKELDLPNLEIQEVNLEIEGDLRIKYNIRNVPMLVVLNEDGKEIERIRDIEQLKNFLSKLPKNLEPVEECKEEEEVKISWFRKIFQR